ncbi:MAG: LptF/LptG family permease [Flavisolibacter sp.]
MLTKIDRYILGKFFTTFIFCMLLFTAIAVAVDSSEKADNLVKSGLSTGEIIRQYYIGFIPWIWGLLYPLFVFIAVIFFTSKMALRSEVIAILANGVSYNRWLRPYFIGGVVFAIVLFFANQYGIPKANALKSEFQAKYIDDFSYSNVYQSYCYNCYYKRLDSVTYAGMKNYDTLTKSAHPFFMEKVRNNQVFYNLRAERITWDTAQKNWKLFGVVERTINGKQESVRNVREMNLHLSLKPEELRKDEYLKDKLTSNELARYIKVEENRATEGLNPLKVELYRRSATPFTVLLLTLIGAIIAGRKTRGGSGLHLAIGIIIASLFIISDRFSTVFSTKGSFPPLLAAWVPNIAFALVAIFMYRRAPK